MEVVNVTALWIFLIILAIVISFIVWTKGKRWKEETIEEVIKRMKKKVKRELKGLSPEEKAEKLREALRRFKK